MRSDPGPQRYMPASRSIPPSVSSSPHTAAHCARWAVCAARSVSRPPGPPTAVVASVKQHDVTHAVCSAALVLAPHLSAVQFSKSTYSSPQSLTASSKGAAQRDHEQTASKFRPRAFMSAFPMPLSPQMEPAGDADCRQAGANYTATWLLIESCKSHVSGRAQCAPLGEFRRSSLYAFARRFAPSFGSRAAAGSAMGKTWPPRSIVRATGYASAFDSRGRLDVELTTQGGHGTS